MVNWRYGKAATRICAGPDVVRHDSGAIGGGKLTPSRARDGWTLMLETYQAKYPAPFAVLAIRASAERLIGIDYLPPGAASLAPLNALAEKVCRQLERYVEDPGYRFRLPFDYVGTPFQCRVWRAISGIASGSTRTYAVIARELKTAPRPVGGACGANRIPIVIPCHRVLASNGLGGFMHARKGFPLEVKRWLLEHEGAIRNR